MQLSTLCWIPIHTLLSFQINHDIAKTAAKICSYLQQKIASNFGDKNNCNNISNESCLAIKLPKNSSNLFCEFNPFSSDVNNSSENIINSKYYILLLEY